MSRISLTSLSALAIFFITEAVDTADICKGLLSNLSPHGLD